MIRVSCIFQSCFFKGSAFVEDGFTTLLLYNSKNIITLHISVLFFKGSAFVEDGFAILLLYNSKNIFDCGKSLLDFRPALLEQPIKFVFIRNQI